MQGEFAGRAALLTRLPAVPLDIILENLGLASLKKLRLVSRSLSDRCIGPHFKSFFRNPKTDLSQRSLRSLDELVSHPLLGSAVTSITVMAVVYNTSGPKTILETKKKRLAESRGAIRSMGTHECTAEELAAAQEDLDWMHSRLQGDSNMVLSDVVDTLACIFRKLGRLDSVKLDASCISSRAETGPVSFAKEWVLVWISASRAFSVTTSSTAKSAVGINSFVVFQDTMKCSVQSGDITNHMKTLDPDGFAGAGKQIKDFSISFSTRTRIKQGFPETEFPQTEPPDMALDESDLYKGDEPEALALENFIGVAAMLSQMPNLEAIDLHQFHTFRGRGNAYDKLFANIAKDVRLPALERVTLRGLYVKEGDLLLFLAKHPRINHLDLREIHVTSGSWDPLLAHFSKMPALLYLRLSTLRGGGHGILNLDAKRAEFSKYNCRVDSYTCGDGIFVHTREISIEELRAGLDFKPPPTGRALGSGNLMRFKWSRRAHYGPP